MFDMNGSYLRFSHISFHFYDGLPATSLPTVSTALKRLKGINLIFHRSNMVIDDTDLEANERFATLTSKLILTYDE